MKIWQMIDPIDGHWASGHRRGTWTSLPGQEGLCPSCRGSRQIRVSPLIMEWDRRAKGFGDFTWPGPDEILISKPAWNFLEARFARLKVGPVESVSIKKWVTPQIFDLRLPGPVPIAPESTVEQTFACEHCGRKQFDIHGIEKISVRWNKISFTGLTVRTARDPSKGIFIRREDVADLQMFRIKEQPNFALCTQVARNEIEAQGLTNIAFLEVGTVLTDS